MEERTIDQLSPETRKLCEAYLESMRGATPAEWETMAISVNARRIFGEAIPEQLEKAVATIPELYKSPVDREMWRYILNYVPFQAKEQLKALKWVFPASWGDDEAYKEAYLKGFSYFLDEMREEEEKSYAPLSLNYEQQNARFEKVAKERISVYLESRYPRIEEKLFQAIQKAVVLKFVIDNSDETEVGEIYYIAKSQNGLKPGKGLTARDKDAIEWVAGAVLNVVIFWALNFCKWVACLMWNDEADERQYISEAEAEEHDINELLFNEVAYGFGHFISAYHKAALAGIQGSGEEYLSTDYEALLPAFAEQWEATEQMGGYNALMDRVRKSRYSEYFSNSFKK